MAEPFLGEIRMFGGNFAPLHWAFCYGQLLTIADNTALFSIVGTAYGGDGRTNFGIPDLRGRIPIHQGQGPELPPRSRGEMYGQEGVTLTVDQIPPHQHPMQATKDNPVSASPLGQVLATPDDDGLVLYTNPEGGSTRPLSELADVAVNKAGGGGSHSNMMPSMCVSFIIALQGYYPTRN